MSGTEAGDGGRSVGGGGTGTVLGVSLRGGALKHAAIPTAIVTHSGSASARDNLTAVSRLWPRVP
jgi:hypothetical protein